MCFCVLGGILCVNWLDWGNFWELPYGVGFRPNGRGGLTKNNH
jgi:hypothetical protein